jgi:tetratricopeptide (TPR) repeat protein
MGQRDPLYRPGIANLNRYFVFRGETEKAQAMVERIRPFMPNDPFLLRIQANIHYANGHVAKGLRMMETALEIQPDNGPNINLRGQGLLDTAQYERLAEEGTPPGLRIEALYHLGRMEEATILAYERANSGEDVGSLIGILANSGKPEQMVEFFEERWDSLDAFEEDHPLLGGNMGQMLDIAYAYGSVGNEERFDDALKRSRTALDSVTKMGFKNAYITIAEAAYHTMTGDRETAIALLATAVDEQGWVHGTKFSDGWAALKVLEGDPEYEAVQLRMVNHLNAERLELGLEAVEA